MSTNNTCQYITINNTSKAVNKPGTTAVCVLLMIVVLLIVILSRNTVNTPVSVAAGVSVISEVQEGFCSRLFSLLKIE